MFLLLDGMMDFLTWCTTELQTPNSTVAHVIANFVARLTGRTRKWWINLGEFR